MSKKKGRGAQDDWAPDQVVTVVFGDEPYQGTITLLTNDKATVAFDDGEVLDVPISELTLVRDTDSRKRVVREEATHDLTVDVQWGQGLTFKVIVEPALEGVTFTGAWRRTVVVSGVAVFAIDTWLHCDGKVIVGPTLTYQGDDPRDDLDALNADIAAALQGHLAHHLNGHWTIPMLVQKATNPTVRMINISTLDALVMKLRDQRDTALRCGGRHTFAIKGDDFDNNPTLLVIDIDMTDQAIAMRELKQIPPLMVASAFDKDSTTKTGLKGSQAMVAATSGEKTLSMSNVGMLCDQLDKCDTGSPEYQKITSTLRRMGWKGGARAYKRWLAKQDAEHSTGEIFTEGRKKKGRGAAQETENE